MSDSKDLASLRWNFLELTRAIYCSQRSKEDKENLRKESEDKFDEIKKQILEK